MKMNPMFRFKDIAWSPPTRSRSVGDKGAISTTGVEIFTMDRLGDGYVAFRPVSNRTVIRNCYIELPFDSAALQAVSDHLAVLATQALAFEVEARKEQAA